MRLEKAFTLGLGSLTLGLGSLAAACVGTKGNCGPRQAVNNGASGTITVTAAGRRLDSLLAGRGLC